MNYTEVCQGWIYCITNKVNGKKYIGQTVNYTKRMYRHFHDEEEKCYKLNRALKKYGTDNFIMEPLIHFTAINKQVRAKVLNCLERFYIERFDTYHNGYNCTTGGAGLRDYIVSEETRKKLSESHKEHAKNNRLKYRNRPNKREILQYDLHGRLCRLFPSIADAAKEFEDAEFESVKAGISANLKGIQPSAKGFIWKYKESDEISLFIDIPTPYNAQPVYYYSKEHKLIAKYNSIKEASEMTGTLSKSIYTHTRKHNRKFYRTNYWSFQSPEEKSGL